MLHIVFANETEIEGLHIPFRPEIRAAVRNQEKIGNLVAEVQADGEELEYVRSRFPNVLYARGTVVTWFGEQARFIARNL